MKFRRLKSICMTVAAAIMVLLGSAGIRAQAAPETEAGSAGLVFVEGGTYTIGEMTFGFELEGAHEVEVSSFYIGAHEVTVAEYAEFMADDDSMTIIPRFLLEFGLKTKAGQIWTGKDYEAKTDAAWDNTYFVQDDDHPVVLVTWNDAAQYCNWRSLKEGLEEVYQADETKSRYYTADFSKNGYRLPTEAEWEWAARGGIHSMNYSYSGSDYADEVAWLSENSNQATHPVGAKMPNELGIYDLCGNAFEWCNDWFGAFPADASEDDLVVDPLGPASGETKVIRGSSWIFDEEASLTVERAECPPDIGFNDLGFRLVRASGPGTNKPLPAAALPPETGIPKGLVEMVPVEGGSFVMGNDSGPSDTMPAHKVTVASFHIARYEVTVGQFRKFAEETGYRTDAEKDRGGYIYKIAQWVVEPNANWKVPYFEQKDTHPAVLITWWDAVNFCNALSDAEGLDRVYEIDGHSVSGYLWNNGYRLPTEAEWEYAARGGALDRNTTYAGSNNAAEVAWFKRHYSEGTRPVGEKAPNELGIYDMSGNVWEWCQDRYAPYTAEAQSNPCASSKEMKFVLRGGCWLNGEEGCAVYYRLKDEPSNTDFTFGFRVVRRP